MEQESSNLQDVLRRFLKSTGSCDCLLKMMEPTEQMRMQLLSKKWYDVIVPTSIWAISANVTKSKLLKMLATEPENAKEAALKTWRRLGPLTWQSIEMIAPDYAPLKGVNERTCHY